MNLIPSIKKITAAIILFSSVEKSFSQVNWPTVTQQTKPWTRWWWEGSAVDKKNLTWNLEQYQKAGLGGVEITPIYGINGYEKRFINFLTPQWMQMLTHTLNESKRLKIGVDLANATGWPFGGTWVTDKDASKTIYFKTFIVNANEQLNEKIEYVREALVRTANNKQVSIDTLKQPVAVNKDLQSLALDQIQYPGKLLLRSLMAYSDKGVIIDVTNKVDANAKLNWIAPEGKWTLYALFEGLHGKMVERAAPGGEGYAIDHFSATAANNYFKKFDNAFKGYNISYLRSFFNDSYEVDDAKEQANWTPALFTEFTKRKGYDLREHLPALLGTDNVDNNSRVLYDYRSVIDELLLEKFTQQWKKWAVSKGKMVRNQSHGSPANTLDLYSVVDIPETEGTDILRFKFATSAANVTGKKLASSESATWLNEHFLSSWGDVKKAIDLYFLGGVNHIFYHGTAYSPQDAPWPGWLFYAAVHFQPINPQWKDFHALNSYITRTQSFLQSSKPDNDILVYYPIVDRYSTLEKSLLQHFDGMGREFEGTDFNKISSWMLGNDYSFDFFSDKQLQKFSFLDNSIVTSNNKYQTILLPANEYIPESSFQKIIDLAKQGATVLVYKNLPKDVPGFGKLNERRKTFQSLINQLQFVKYGDVTKADIGKGCFIVAGDMKTLFIAANIRKETLHEKNVEFLRKKNDAGTLYFIDNRNDKAFNDWIQLNTSAVSVAAFDAMTGKKGLVDFRKTANGKIEIKLQLQPYASTILQLYSIKKTGEHFPAIEKTGNTQVLTDNKWTVSFLNGGPVLPATVTLDRPVYWNTLQADEYKNFSGVAKYSTSFNKPKDSANAWLLDLGKVNETAEIILNGKSIATLIGPSFQTVIPASLLKENNTLEIVVANLMANRISYMDKNNLPWKIFYNTNMPARLRENSKNGLFSATDWKPLPSGIASYITLTPISYK
jgi:hypothetical protein